MIALPLKAMAPRTASASPGTSCGSGVLLNGSSPGSSVECGTDLDGRTVRMRPAPPPTIDPPRMPAGNMRRARSAQIGPPAVDRRHEGVGLLPGSRAEVAVGQN